jgi:transcriptional regulator with AAA-type ATPase domain
MSRIKIISIVCLFLLMISGFASFVSSQTGAGNPAKAPQAENDLTMQALLNEVRQLRLAIQRSNLSAYKSQVTIERIRSQQQSVDRLADRLRDVRNQLAGVRMALTDFQSELKRIEGRLNQEVDVEKRRVLEEEQERFKSRLAMHAQEEGRMRDSESQLASQLQIEQGRLTELNDQLDVLQRELELPLTESNPAQNGKRP